MPHRPNSTRIRREALAKGETGVYRPVSLALTSRAGVPGRWWFPYKKTAGVCSYIHSPTPSPLPYLDERLSADLCITLQFCVSSFWCAVQRGKNLHPPSTMAPTKEVLRNPLHIIVVGAGLGGLSAAIASRLAGHTVIICEQALVLGEVNSSRYPSHPLHFQLNPKSGRSRNPDPA
jgi:hypothetical protein